MNDELDRDRGHQLLEASLGLEPFGKARFEQRIPDAITKAARDHDTAETALGKGDVARNTAQRHAETIDCRSSKAVAAVLPALPDRDIVFLGDRAAQYIRDNRDRPFALCVSYLEPHPPHTGPLNEFYDPSSLPTGPAFMQKPAANVPLIVRLMAAIYMESEEYGCDLRTEEGWREVMARYWGNTTLVDRSVANILGALDECGLADDTIVMFSSDNGPEVTENDLFPGAGSVTFGKAANWLKQRPPGPFFMFVHTYEVHAPYAPARDERTQL